MADGSRVSQDFRGFWVRPWPGGPPIDDSSSDDVFKWWADRKHTYLLLYLPRHLHVTCHPRNIWRAGAYVFSTASNIVTEKKRSRLNSDIVDGLVYGCHGVKWKMGHTREGFDAKNGRVEEIGALPVALLLRTCNNSSCSNTTNWKLLSLLKHYYWRHGILTVPGPGHNNYLFCTSTSIFDDKNEANC